MDSLLKKLLPLQVLLAAVIATSVACSSSAPPPAPATKSADGEYSSKNSKNMSSRSGDAKEKDEDEGDEDEEELAKSSFDFGGAEIGDKEVIEAVKTCHEKGRFYDRFHEDEALGKCTSLKLAQVSCSSKDLKKILSAKQKEQFEKALADDSSSGYKGWKIDQCLDCEKGGDEELCKNSSGKEQVGTKIFFVKEENDEISGKSMVLPVRPK